MNKEIRATVTLGCCVFEFTLNRNQFDFCYDEEIATVYREACDRLSLSQLVVLGRFEGVTAGGWFCNLEEL